MGTCCFPRNSIIYRVETISNHPGTVLTQVKEKVEEEIFLDMPEIPEKFNGLGIKRMKAYKCDLNIDELNGLREHFWKVKIMMNERYKLLRQAILYDSLKCEDYIIKNGFQTIDGCINRCTDFTKTIFKIPNYCINDPYFEKVILPIDNTTPHNKKITVYISENDTKTKLEIPEGISGRELKEMYVKEKNLPSENSKYRMFFGGNEIKDNEYIYQHKIDNDYIIQIIKTL